MLRLRILFCIDAHRVKGFFYADVARRADTVDSRLSRSRRYDKRVFDGAWMDTCTAQQDGDAPQATSAFLPWTKVVAARVFGSRANGKYIPRHMTQTARQHSYYVDRSLAAQHSLEWNDEPLHTAPYTTFCARSSST
tara:strand:+ start:5014 stop:5424 length:411 start_codon:yes stop_codon:yes gene_type:complete